MSSYHPPQPFLLHMMIMTLSFVPHWIYDTILYLLSAVYFTFSDFLNEKDLALVDTSFVLIISFLSCNCLLGALCYIIYIITFQRKWWCGWGFKYYMTKSILPLENECFEFLSCTSLFGSWKQQQSNPFDTKSVYVERVSFFNSYLEIQYCLRSSYSHTALRRKSQQRCTKCRRVFEGETESE